MTCMIEFATADTLLAAVPRLREAGFPAVEAYTPHAVDGLQRHIPGAPSRVRPVMLTVGILGGLGAFGFQAWSAVVDYPINAGGRAPFSWPAFVPVTFEITILLAALGGFVAMLVACGLTRLDHPTFDVPGFERASQDRFFLEVRCGRSIDTADRLRVVLGDITPVAIREMSP